MSEATRRGMNAHFDGMCWPVLSQELNDLEWRLRYGPAPEKDRFSAASVISAYRALMLLPTRDLAKRMRQLKAMSKLPDVAAQLGGKRP